jgi:hypothetical protein
VRLPLRIQPHPRIPFIFGTKRIAEQGGALIAKIVFAAVVGRIPLAPLQQNNTQASDREFLGDNSARRARSNYHSIHALHEGETFLRSYCARPRIGGSARPSIRQLTASRLPPCRGEP